MRLGLKHILGLNIAAAHAQRKRGRALCRGLFFQGQGKPAQGVPYIAAGAFSAAAFLAFAEAFFFTLFLAGIATGAAATGASTAAAGALTAAGAATATAGARAAAGAGVAANVMPEPNRPATTNRAVRLDFMVDPKSIDPWVGCCHIGLEPTERDFTEPDLV
jgi:hypothetical protein